jgi:hypothetical protein
MSESRRNTKWTQGKTCFEHPPLEDFIGMADGFFPIPATIDPKVGKEVVLYLRDQTSFMEEICRVRPFQLMLNTGVARNNFGPLAFLLFWIPNHDNPAKPFAAYDVYLNPHSKTQMETWRQLANQTHWHLFLIGEGGKQREFFEFENTFDLGDALDFMIEASGPVQMIDFNRAKQMFMVENSMEKLLGMEPATPDNCKPPQTIEPASEAESPFSSPRYVAIFQESIARHERSPEVSEVEYLKQKHAELSALLAGKKLIYLDTCHWVNLRHVMLQSEKRQPPYDQILGQLEKLRSKDQICCPVSQALFEELMKQSDTKSRTATANLMDYMSGGVCVQNWIDLVRLEWRQFIAETLLEVKGSGSSLNAFTKAGFWAGEHIVPVPHCGELVGRKLYIDMRWAMTFQDYQAIPGFTKTPDSLTDAFVAEATERKLQAEKHGLNFSYLVGKNRIALVNSMKNDFFPILEKMCPPTREIADMNISALMRQLVDNPTPWNMPSFQIVAGAGAAIAAKGRRTRPNDALDMVHAAVAIPYCDAFFCDNPMANLFREKPLEYQKAYETTILSQPTEIAAYLDSIS